MDEGPKFFQTRTINYGTVINIILVSALMGLSLGYRMGVRIYANPKKMKKLKELKNLIKFLKEIKDDAPVN
jgi:D-serine dehydratase